MAATGTTAGTTAGEDAADGKADGGEVAGTAAAAIPGLGSPSCISGCLDIGLPGIARGVSGTLGTWSTCWQPGHLPRLPAIESATLNLRLQLAQKTRIATPSSPYLPGPILSIAVCGTTLQSNAANSAHAPDARSYPEQIGDAIRTRAHQGNSSNRHSPGTGRDGHHPASRPLPVLTPTPTLNLNPNLNRNPNPPLFDSRTLIVSRSLSGCRGCCGKRKEIRAANEQLLVPRPGRRRQPRAFEEPRTGPVPAG